jgi:3-keto-disaccharide hydrolase
MKRILWLMAALGLALGVGAVPSLRANDEAKGWTNLFNGKDLTGWRIFLDPRKKVDPAEIFQVKNGTIVCEGSVNGYIITEKEYSNYVLKLQWRWGKKKTSGRNSGVFVHVVGPDMIWPKGVEAQLMADHAGDFWLVGDFKLSVDPRRQDRRISRHYFRTKDNVEKAVGEWNQYEITCKGDTIKLVINGLEVNRGTNAELTKGRILLQSEGAEIHFRDIKLKSSE